METAFPQIVGVQAPKVLGEQVLINLRQLIVTGNILPGAHLVENELAQAFNVSRGPVREALGQLLRERLVGSRRGRIYVIGVTRQDIDELYHVRLLIESEALRLVIEGDADEIDMLDTKLNTLKLAQATQDAEQYAKADLDFHTAFYTATKHRRLGDIWSLYRPTFAGILSVTNAEDEDLSPSYDDHVELLEAVKQRNGLQAIRVLESHLEGSKRRFLIAQERRGVWD